MGGGAGDLWNTVKATAARNPPMAKTPDDKIDAIKTMREAGWSKTKTSQALGISDTTVDKYQPKDVEGWDEQLDPTPEQAVEDLPEHVDPRDVLTDKFLPESMEREDTGEFTGTPPGESPLKDESTQELRIQTDYSEVGPGEFIEMFFDDFEVGVREQFVLMQSRRAKRKQEIPDEERMRSLLLELGSGVSNQTEARFIAEEYWAEAEQYLAESNMSVDGTATAGGSPGESTGDYVQPGENQSQQGEWVEMPGRGMVYGRFEQGPNGARRFIEMQPPQQQQPQQQPPQQQGYSGAGMGSNPEVQALREELRELRSAVTNDQQNDLTSQIQQFKEIQEQIQALSGAEEDATQQQLVEQLQQQMAALRQEMHNNQQPSDANSPAEHLFQQALQSEDTDIDRLMDLADRIDGEVDPEVEKKKMEMKMKEREMERKQETTDKVMSGLEDAWSAIGQGIGEALAGGGDDGDGGGGQSKPEPEPQQQPQQQPRQASDGGETQRAYAPQQQQQPETQQWECPACGEMSQVDPRTPGVACEHCDFTRAPCPDCGSPIDIPPAEEAERAGCPDCGEPVPLPEDGEGHVACVAAGCEWHGDAEEAMGDTVSCDNCGTEHPINSAPPQAR